MAQKRKGKRSREPEAEDSFFESAAPSQQQVANYKLVLAYIIDPGEVALLIEASTAAYVDPEVTPEQIVRSTYSAEEATSLVNGAAPITSSPARKPKIPKR